MYDIESLKKSIQGATSHLISDLRIDWHDFGKFASWGGSFPTGYQQGSTYTITVFVKLKFDFPLQEEIRKHYRDFQGAMSKQGARFIFPDCSDNNLHYMLKSCQLMAIPMDMSHSAVLEFETRNLDDFGREMERAARTRFESAFTSQLEQALAS